jgi:hypothetical protein
MALITYFVFEDTLVTVDDGTIELRSKFPSKGWIFRRDRQEIYLDKNGRKFTIHEFVCALDELISTKLQPFKTKYSTKLREAEAECSTKMFNAINVLLADDLINELTNIPVFKNNHSKQIITCSQAPRAIFDQSDVIDLVNASTTWCKMGYSYLSKLDVLEFKSNTTTILVKNVGTYSFILNDQHNRVIIASQPINTIFIQNMFCDNAPNDRLLHMNTFEDRLSPVNACILPWRSENENSYQLLIRTMMLNLPIFDKISYNQFDDREFEFGQSKYSGNKLFPHELFLLERNHDCLNSYCYDCLKNSRMSGHSCDKHSIVARDKLKTSFPTLKEFARFKLVFHCGTWSELTHIMPVDVLEYIMELILRMCCGCSFHRM